MSDREDRLEEFRDRNRNDPLVHALITALLTERIYQRRAEGEDGWRGPAPEAKEIADMMADLENDYSMYGEFMR